MNRPQQQAAQEHPAKCAEHRAQLQGLFGTQREGRQQEVVD